MPPASNTSRSRSRVQSSGRATPTGRTYVGQAEELILPEGPISEQTAELLQEFVHPHMVEDTLADEQSSEEEEELSKVRSLPWWKRPSPWWLLVALPFTAIAMSATIAPRIEVYTTLACRVIRPDIYSDVSQPNTAVLSTVAETRPQRCAADPVVQAAVAKLSAGMLFNPIIFLCLHPSSIISDVNVYSFNAAMTTSMGILSCLTTGWWGAFSDRYGRGRVMGISVLGLLLTDFIFIFVALFPDRAPGGYWFLLLGPLVEGSLGGFTGAMAAIHAYQADTTSHHDRSRIFSLSLGLVFTGMAIGPTLGALLIRSTGQILSVFYVSAGSHLIYAFLVWFILPESLSLSYRLRARAKYAEEVQVDSSGRNRSFTVRLLVVTRRLFAFLSPLSVLSPEVKDSSSNPLKKRKRDWNLTLLGIAYALTTSIMGSYTYKFQYAASTFGWTSETLGYWLSLVGAARAIYLTVLLPVAIKLFKPKPITIEIPRTTSETEPLLSSSESNGDLPKKKKEIHSPAFDLGLGRISLLIEIVAYTFMALAPTPFAFTVFGMLSAMGAAFSPATQTVALALYTRRGGTESGRLFGALSVLQALGSQILGPSLYGIIYVKTVSTYPRTIFLVTVLTVIISSILLSCVRLPKEYYPPHAMAASADEDIEEPNTGPSGASARSSEGTLVGARATA
ncbi:MFS general substrate transporter [Macrolepiota fuliginosa MF-IS2]|uniref:MFS general substrate transporter n=1 Tax=Macrolepiota fuliginosa MF-IS2 TaxID=1400762 RepID=A0A9P5X5A2_9AGAR|nr:MFS general substrate transporter [Macrolepiota fuliginosa MF-IS2]